MIKARHASIESRRCAPRQPCQRTWGNSRDHGHFRYNLAAIGQFHPFGAAPVMQNARHCGIGFHHAAPRLKGRHHGLHHRIRPALANHHAKGLAGHTL